MTPRKPPQREQEQPIATQVHYDESPEAYRNVIEGLRFLIGITEGEADEDGARKVG